MERKSPANRSAVAACRNLVAALPEVVAVVRPHDTRLAEALAATGARVVRCERADDGMGASLACGVRATPEAAGWIVALGDMPWIAASTIEQVARAIAAVRSSPRRFIRGSAATRWASTPARYAELAALGGDDGAKSVLAAHHDALMRIDVDDAGALRDVDRPSDLD
jgi:molybdenum cofactor cytidylyltransferase